MKAVLQRVRSAKVIADGEFCSSISGGLLILLGVEEGDGELDCELLASKILKLRIFSDSNGKMNLSVCDVSGEILVVSNFTLNANYSHGNRPDYLSGAKPDRANELYLYFVSLIEQAKGNCAAGRFGSDMQIDAALDGPVTIVMESDKLKKK